MVFRIAIESTTATVEGELDQRGLEEVLVRCRETSATRLVLRAGTVVRAECMATLARLTLEVTAESPYLSHWLTQLRDHERRP